MAKLLSSTKTSEVQFQTEKQAKHDQALLAKYGIKTHVEVTNGKNTGNKEFVLH